MKTILSFLVLNIFVLFSIGARSQPKDLANLAYGTGKQHTIDLFLPGKFGLNTPVVIIIHGGAWIMGGKEYTDKTARDLRAKGFIVANIDYRYVSESVHGVDLLKDVDQAVAFVETLSKEYNFSNSGYHLAGISAGAHLSLLYGYTTKKNIKSISALCAPSRFDDPEIAGFIQQNNLEKNIGWLADTTYQSPQMNQKLADVSPYSHVKNIPTLLIHGDKDPLVPFSQSVALDKKLQQQQIQSKLVIMKGKGHDVGMNDPASEQKVLEEIANWVLTHN